MEERAAKAKPARAELGGSRSVAPPLDVHQAPAVPVAARAGPAGASGHRRRPEANGSVPADVRGQGSRRSGRPLETRKMGGGMPARPSAATGRGHARQRPAGSAVVARLRRLCLTLPEAVEKLSHGEPTWFAGAGKVFATLDDHHHGAEHLSVWLPLPLGAQEALMAEDPARFFRPPYVGGRGWVAVVLDGAPDWRQVAALLREAYLTVASRRLAARLRGTPSRGAPAPAGAAPTRRASTGSAR